MKQFVFIIFILITSCQRNQNKKENQPKKITKTTINFKVAKSDYTIISSNMLDDWIFKNTKPSELTESELIDIEKILTIAIKENNKKQKIELKKHNEIYPKNKLKETGFELKLKGKKRQYIPVINEKGEKEIWVNFFCDWENDSWKSDIMFVEDGGNCYFNLKINLTKKTYSELRINGNA